MVFNRFCFIMVCLSTALAENYKSDDSLDYKDFYDLKYPEKNVKKTLVDSYGRKLDTNLEPVEESRYEVTEHVIDLPNTETVKPIVTNFTIVTPLNNATKTTVKNSNKSKKATFSFTHINADIEPDKNTGINVNNYNIFPNKINAIKHKLANSKLNLLKYVYAVILKKKNRINQAINEHNIFVPASNVLNVLHKKSEQILDKLHNEALKSDVDFFDDF